MADPCDRRHARMASLPMSVFLTAIVGLGAFSIDTFLPSLPAMMRALRGDAATAQLTVTLFLASFAGAQLVFGPLSDRFGRRAALLGGLVLYLAGAAGSLLAPSLPALVAARVVQGLGGGSGPVLSRTIVRDVHPPHEAARVLSLMAVAQAVAPMVAPVVGGVLQARWGWRAAFAFMAALGLAFLAAALGALEETSPHHGPRPAANRRVGLRAGAAELARHRAFLGFLLALTLVFSGQFAFISGSAGGCMGVLGLSARAYGFAFALVAFGIMTGSFLAARYARRLGPERVIRRGAALAAASGLAMAGLVAAGRVSAPGILGPMYLYAVGVGAVMPNAFAGGIAPFPHMAGLASALLGFAQMTGAALYSIAVSRFYDGTARPMAFAIACAGVACLVSALALRRTGPERDKTAPCASSTR
jgi:DHA1 family bicyclomycin/chloramphenicol resistance-like MFS transporter